METDLGGTAVSFLTCRFSIGLRVSALVGRQSRCSSPADPRPLRPPGRRPDPAAVGPRRGGTDGHAPVCSRLCRGSSHGDPASHLLMTGSENGLGLGTGQARPGKDGLRPGHLLSSPAYPPPHLPADPAGQVPGASSALLPVRVSSGHHLKGPQPGSLDSRFTVSGLEAGIPGPGVGRAGPPEAPSWACRWLSPPRVPSGSSLCVSQPPLPVRPPVTLD